MFIKELQEPIRRRKVFYISTLVFLIVVLFIGIFTFQINRSEKVILRNSNFSNSGTTKVVDTKIDLNYSNWKTVVSTKYNFSFKYPPSAFDLRTSGSYKLYDTPRILLNSKSADFDGGTVSVFVEENVKNTDLSEWVQNPKMFGKYWVEDREYVPVLENVVFDNGVWIKIGNNQNNFYSQTEGNIVWARELEGYVLFIAMKGINDLNVSNYAEFEKIFVSNFSFDIATKPEAGWEYIPLTLQVSETVNWQNMDLLGISTEKLVLLKFPANWLESGKLQKMYPSLVKLKNDQECFEGYEVLQNQKFEKEENYSDGKIKNFIISNSTGPYGGVYLINHFCVQNGDFALTYYIWDDSEQPVEKQILFNIASSMVILE